MFLKGQPLDMPALQQVLAQAQQLPLPRRPAVRLWTADDTDYQAWRVCCWLSASTACAWTHLPARGGTGKTA
ncbi:TPA: hypothetical protein ACKP5X_002976 [Stenotrophomonas maltophilia]